MEKQITNNTDNNTKKYGYTKPKKTDLELRLGTNVIKTIDKRKKKDG